MLDTRALFLSAWTEELEKRLKESPSFTTDQFTVTGKASAQYGGKRGLSWWEDHGPSLVDNWVEWRKSTRWPLWETPDGAPGIELELNVTLPGDIPVKMFLDRVFVLPSGAIGVVDLKTGRLPETPEQLGLYATGMELTYGIAHRPHFGYWWDANKGVHVGPFDLDMYTPNYFSVMYREAVSGINAGSFLPKPANACGRWCGVARACAAVGGAEAHKYDPLLQIQS